MEQNYSRSPFFSDANELLAGGLASAQKTISQLNIELISRINTYLNVNTPMILSSEFNLEGAKTERLINLLKKIKATSYLSGPSADAYLDKEQFRANRIGEYKSYDYPTYPQLWVVFWVKSQCLI